MKVKKSKISVWLGALSLVLVLSSCTSESLLPSEQPNKEYMEFLFELIPPGAFTPAQTRANIDQNTITNAQILVFKGEALLYQKSGTVTNNKMTVPLQASQSESDLFDIMVIGNPPAFAFNDYVGKTKEELKTAFNIPLTGKWPGPGFIMYGEVLKTLIKTTGNAFKIQMLRSLARVDIGVGVYSETAGTWPGLGGVFSLTEVRVVNSRNQFAVIPSATTPNTSGNVTVSAPTIPAGTAVQDKTVEANIKYSGAAEITNGSYIKSTIFIAEAPNTPAADRVTLLIGGSYKNGATTYYRVDMCVAKADETGYDYLNVLRNHLYRVSITNILGPGFATPEGALSSVPINIKATLTPIAEGDGSGDILFDGDNSILTDVSNVQIYGVPDGQKSYNIATVKATFAAGVATVSVDGINTPISLTSGVAKLISVVIPEGAADGKIAIQAGRLKKVIPFTVQPPVDAHFDVLPFAHVASITVENLQAWLTLSQNMKYVKAEQQSLQIAGNSLGKACFHFEENIALSGTPRTARALVFRNDNSGTTGVVFEQLNLSGMVLGYFGGSKGTDGYTQRLAIESVEECTERVYDDTSMGGPLESESGIQWGFKAIFIGAIDKELGKASTITLAGEQNSDITGPFTIYNNYAARYCYDKNRGTGLNGAIKDTDVEWYLPAHNQLIGAWIVNNGIAKPLTSAYWSATEYYQHSSWGLLVMVSGLAYNENKIFVGIPFSVRCVRDLK